MLPSQNMENQRRSAEQQRINEVARMATELVKSNPDMTRTEALRIADRIVPYF